MTKKNKIAMTKEEHIDLGVKLKLARGLLMTALTKTSKSYRLSDSCVKSLSMALHNLEIARNELDNKVYHEFDESGLRDIYYGK